MDLGCLDLGCISVLDKQSTETVIDSSNNESSEPNEPVSVNSKTGKSKSPRGNNQPTWNVLSKCSSQIKKPPHRKNSPLNWFPRKKVDSYLKRKIKMLQEVDGMNLTLDETLGDTNPHYSRVLREKIAAREAAHKAMEARKAALVETSWCRILKAARIQSKEAEALLLKSEKTAAEAFEAATAMGVIMYDKPNCPQVHCQIETSLANGGGSTTHTVTASFETAFEVDKEVAAAVKTAFIRLANCSPFSKDEFKDLLHRINENPDTGDSNQKLPEFSSECESESGSELKIVSQKNGFGSQHLDAKMMPVLGIKQSKSKRRQSSENLNKANLVEMMLERLKCLQEDELSSLATIVATCGLNAALAEVENNKTHYSSSVTDFPYSSVANSQSMSSLGAGTMRNDNLEYLMNGPVRRKQIESGLPSLDKCLVKHMSKLEREVQEAKNSKMNGSKETIGENPCKFEDGTVQSETTDLGSVLLKHSSKFEKEIEEEKKNSGNNFQITCKNSEAGGVPNEEVPHRMKDVPEIPSLDKFLVKHVSRLEKEVQEAKNRRNNDQIEKAKNSGNSFEMLSKNPEARAMPNEAASHRKEGAPEVTSLDKFLVKHISRLEKEVLDFNIESQSEKNAFSSFNRAVPGKENIDLNKEDSRLFEIEEKDMKVRTEENVDSLEKILVKPIGNNYRNHRTQKIGRNNETDCDGLDKVLIKHVSRLEKEKMKFNASEEAVKVKKSMHSQSQMKEENSLDKVLVKHKSRLEREKMAAAAQQPEEQVHNRPFVSRKEVRERELQEAWGGLSLGNSIRPRLSKLEQDKAPSEEQVHNRQFVSLKEARERELQEAWGGLSLGNSIRPHLSKLERDKAAWIKAEEEERKQAMRDVV